MATYSYDDFRVTLTQRSDGSYDMVSLAPDGTAQNTVFAVPLSAEQLEQAVVSLATTRSRAAHAGSATREVAPAGEGVALDAEKLGAALAGALFADGVGKAYDAAREASSAGQRGLRLTLSMADAPALLSLPWEFLYRRPRFIASQRHTPLVRRLDTGSLTAPPAITSTVRILGVVSSPSDLSPLEVEVERGRVEKAVAKMVVAGRVQLDWLDPATPRRLREALRDNSYHILHYVGHSSFTSTNEGAIYLEDDEGRATEVDNTVLANLLADQNSLRLVVLNSCEGARTTLSDPYAGVATTLIQLGVPAVVAMQFEISDKAAILFADELYTNLIGRQDPIDAAVAEARKAIYIEIDRVEWATPVLFVRDPDVQLFDFKVPVAPLPPPPPPDLADETGAGEVDPPVRPRRRLSTPVAIGIGAALAVGIGALVISQGDDNNNQATPTSTPSATSTVVSSSPLVSTDTPASSPTVVPTGGPRPRTGFLSAQILEADGDTHLYPIDLTSRQVGIITTKPGATDTQGVWDRKTNRVAFTRQLPADGPGMGIFYVVPGNFAGDQGKQVAPLVPWEPGEFEHFPAWAADQALFYMRTDGCAPAVDCAEQLRRAEFTAADDGSGFLDALTFVSDKDRPIVPRFVGVTAVAADPINADRLVVDDASGIWLVDITQTPQLFAPAVVSTSITFTPDGNFIVAIVENASGVLFNVYSATGDLIASKTLIGDTHDIRFVSITGDNSGRTLVALAVNTQDPSVAVISRVQVLDDGGVGIVDLLPITTLFDLGQTQAIAL